MIRRARLFLLVALLIAAAIVVANFPLGALLNDRSTVRAETAQLAALRAANRAMAIEARALQDAATVGRIAHEEYGMISRGQRSLVVLPSTTASVASAGNPLADNPIPSSDLLPSDAILDPAVPVAQPSGHGPGFWQRVADRLEFWRSLF